MQSKVKLEESQVRVHLKVWFELVLTEAFWNTKEATKKDLREGARLLHTPMTGRHRPLLVKSTQLGSFLHPSEKLSQEERQPTASGDRLRGEAGLWPSFLGKKNFRLKDIVIYCKCLKRILSHLIQIPAHWDCSWHGDSDPGTWTPRGPKD